MNRLIEFCDICMGQSPASSTYNENGIGLPFYQGNVDFGEVYPTPRVYCSAPQKVAHEGDILISVRAPIGALNMARETCCIGRGLAALTVDNSRCTKKYLWYAISSKVNELNAKGTGSTFKAIGKSVLEETTIVLPNIERQNKISAILDTITELISLRKKQLQKLDDLVKSRFVEMFGDETNPKGWLLIPVESVADVSVGVVIKPAQYYTDSEHGVKAFRSLNIGPMEIKNSDWVYFSKEGNEKNAKTQLKENDLLIVRSGAPGTACVVTKEFEGCNAIDIIIARPNTQKINPYFLCYYTNLPHGKRQIEEGTGGAAQQHFNVGKYNKLKVMLPPMDKQNEFVTFVKHVDSSRLTIQSGLNRMVLLKQSLMQKYFE